MKLKLNLGCGRKKKEGYVNCDWNKEFNPDMVFDLEKGIPLEDNSVDKIFMSHILEHFHEPLNVLKEIYRVCKKDAVLEICVPYFTHQSSFSMLDHYHHFTYTSFDSLDENHRSHLQSVGNFSIIKKKLTWRRLNHFPYKPFILFELLFNRFPKIYQELFCWWFPAKNLEVKLRVVK